MVTWEPRPKAREESPTDWLLAVLREDKEAGHTFGFEPYRKVE